MPGAPFNPRTFWLAAVWTPAAAALLGWAAGWPMGRTALAALLASALATATLLLLLARARRSMTRGLEQADQALWEAIDRPRPDAVFEPDPLARALRSLRAAPGAVRDEYRARGRDRDALRALLDAVPNPVLACDAGGLVTYANTTAGSLFPGRAGPFVGRRVDELFTQADVLAAHAAALGGERCEREARLDTPDGPRVQQIVGVPLPGGGALLSLRDVTAQAVAVQLKADFVANASHELRTPLASIRGALETLSDGAWADPQMRERLARMLGDNVARLEDLVRDLLDLSKLESAEVRVRPEPIRPDELAAAIQRDFGSLMAERSLRLEFSLDPALRTVRTDPSLLALILKNLAENALKFAYEGTAVRVVGELTPAGARFRVIDRGIGIPYDQQARVFERFFQVDPARAGGAVRRGSGLGLAIVKHAVKALGGSVGLESVWKEGTTVTVEVPSLNDNTQPAGAASYAAA